MEKKYYWIKLKNDFFNEKYIKAIRKLPSGDSIVIIYLHLLLTCLSTNGTFQFDGVENTIEDELALVIDEDVNLVKLTISALERFNLLERKDNILYLVGMPVGFIGSESSVTERVRKYREKKKEESKLLQCNSNVTNCNTDIDIELDIDKEKELDKKIETNLDREKILRKLIDSDLLTKEEMNQHPYEDKIFERSSTLTYGLIQNCAIYVLSRLPKDLKNRYELFCKSYDNKLKEAK